VRSYWDYTTAGDAVFDWKDGDPYLSPGAVQVRGGVNLIATSTGANSGYGFQFDVDATPELRHLDVYVGCGRGGTTATYEASLFPAPSTLQATTGRLCDEGTVVPRLNVTFATDSKTVAGKLTLRILTYDDNTSNPTPVVLVAAVLRGPPPGAGGMGGGPGNGAGGNAGGAGGSAKPGDHGFLADRPTACAAAPPGSSVAGLPAMFSLLASVLLARRRRR
jgi:hypothetical protein